jgi:hypothetical protein
MAVYSESELNALSPEVRPTFSTITVFQHPFHERKCGGKCAKVRSLKYIIIMQVGGINVRPGIENFIAR